MILPGRRAIPQVITNVLPANAQTQPCGVDLSLKRIKLWTSPGSIDFDNHLRQSASTTEIPFSGPHEQFRKLPDSTQRALLKDLEALRKWRKSREDSVMLGTGAYLVEFNEIIDMPLTMMGQIFVRSSLFRSGALLSAGVMDSGYRGAIGAMLQVINPHGLLLFRNARLGQMVIHEMSEPVEGYCGVYQGSGSI